MHSLRVVGNTLYVGGHFSTIAGQSRSTSTVNALASDGTTLYLGTGTSTIDTQTRPGLAAFDVSTGNLLAWNPDATGGSVTTLALRGAEVLAKGSFTSVGGQTRNRVAAIDATGAPTVWNPNANLGATEPTVRGLADAGDRILAAGSFTSIGGGGAHVAAINPVTGAKLFWSPGLDAAANAVAANGNLVYVGGTFTTAGGRPRRGLAAFCRAPAPTALTATPGANQVDLAWSGAGAPEYHVFRALAATGPFEAIGTTAVPAYTDLTVQSGIAYYYRVSAFDECESPFSNAASAIPAGSCQLPPDFEGLAWAEPATGATCGVAMGWLPATDPCGGGAFYSVYRDTVVPIPVGSSNPVVFLGAQDGRVYAVDASVGGAAATPPWASPAGLGGMVQAAPAGIFTAFTGAYDYLLAGTRDAGADNAFVALDPDDGSEKGRYQPAADPDRMGIVSGAASVDYATKRVYFTSREHSANSTKTLWSLQLDESPNPVLSLLWARDDLGDIDSSLARSTSRRTTWCG